LNIYGFERISIGRDSGAYHHKFFLRGQYELTLNIERNAIKGTGVRRTRCPTTEPDFYNMPYVVESHNSLQPRLPNEAPSNASVLRVPSVPSANRQEIMSMGQNTMDPCLSNIMAGRARNVDVASSFPPTSRSFTAQLTPSQRFILTDMEIRSSAPYVSSSSDGFLSLGEELHGMTGRLPPQLTLSAERNDLYLAANRLRAASGMAMEQPLHDFTSVPLETVLQARALIDAIHRRTAASSYLDLVQQIVHAGRTGQRTYSSGALSPEEIYILNQCRYGNGMG
jgi:hypothetical protein